MPRQNLWVLFLGSLICYACYVRADHTPFARHLAAAYREIDRSALEDPPDRALFDSAMEGMVAALNSLGDIHSQFIPASVAAEFDAEISQEFGGIGVVITLRGDEPPYELVVVSPPEAGRPAAEHDIRAGDRIIAIDGELVSEMDTRNRNTAEILHRMRGPVGKPVQLTILHPGETAPVEIEVVRDLIATESIRGYRKRTDGSWQYRLDAHPQIAYLRIITFGEKTPGEMYEILRRLVNDGIEGAILDVRDNAGGELDGTVAICDMFLPAGKTIVQTRDRRKRLLETRVATSQTYFPDLPLAVLINDHSASASEILAACIQDHNRGAVIGQRSYGKGTVQRVLPVGPPIYDDDAYQSAYLKLTTSSYWRPSGDNIHRMEGDDEDDDWGVFPDPGMEVELSTEEQRAVRIQTYRRELYNPNGDALVEDLENVPPEVEALLPFKDMAIQKAVDYLHSAAAP